MKKFSSFLTRVMLLSFFFLAVAPVAIPVFSTDSLAQTYTTVSETTDDNILTRTMCNVMRIITGKAGKAFAAFAIISIGIGFFTGKVSWGLMIGVAAGIAAMFGAPSIVSAITGKSVSSCDG